MGAENFPFEWQSVPENQTFLNYGSLSSPAFHCQRHIASCYTHASPLSYLYHMTPLVAETTKRSDSWNFHIKRLQANSDRLSLPVAGKVLNVEQPFIELIKLAAGYSDRR